MIAIDATAVNVALVPIQNDIHFSNATVVWIVNAYLIPFGGFLLIGGRLGDLVGHARLYLVGTVLFALASFVCGVSSSAIELLAARAAQGVAGAVVSAVTLSLSIALFPDVGSRARALAVSAFVSAASGSLGLLLGGTLTSLFGWQWIFLVNMPVGAIVVGLGLRLLPRNRADPRGTRISEKTSRTPLIPLGIFRLRSVVVANVVGILWAAASGVWFYMSSLYMQKVLGLDALEVAFAFLPATIVTAVLSLGASSFLVTRFGTKWPLVAGMMIAAFGLLSFARTPAGDEILVNVLPGMILCGVGAGIACNPLMLAAVSDVPASDTGLASGIINTTTLLGGTVGLALLAGVAGEREHSLLGAGASQETAVAGGLQLAFVAGATSACLGALLAMLFLTRFAAQGNAGASPVSR